MDVVGVMKVIDQYSMCMHNDTGAATQLNWSLDTPENDKLSQDINNLPQY